MFSFHIQDHIYSHIHFIGIGGISMSGLADILLTNGYQVSGSDMKESLIIEKLRKKGAVIYIGHDKNNIKNADLIVYTSAISNDNPEYVEGLNKNIPTIDRATFLGQLMKSYENAIAVAGTHGKTTTTGMMSIILDSSHLSPTILLGGELDQIGGNVKIGTNACLLTEACEYKGNFLKFYPTIGVILNIEEDHLDYYKNLQEIIDTFMEFARLIPEDGTLIINGDDPNIRQILGNVKCNVLTFGINNKSDISASEIHFGDEGYPEFMVTIKDEVTFKASLNVMGVHNIYNALASIAATYQSGVDVPTIKASLKSYTGTHRRFEKKGVKDSVTIIDDYAHHPTEIKVTLSTAKKIVKNNLWCVFQPHTYTRTKALLDEFSDAFREADKVIITDIYAAREKDTGIIHSKDLVERLIKKDVNAIYIKEFNDIIDYLKDHLQEEDLLITMGAGDVYEIGEMLLNRTDSMDTALKP